MSQAWGGGSTTAWRKTRAVVLHRDNYTCQIQGQGCTTRATHVDHIVPKSKGGTDHPDNLRAACRTCNLSRGAPTTDPAPRPRTMW